MSGHSFLVEGLPRAKGQKKKCLGFGRQWKGQAGPGRQGTEKHSEEQGPRAQSWQDWGVLRVELAGWE